MIMNAGLPTPGPHIFWCIGLYASGSTWLFNAGKKIAIASGLGTGLASSFAANQADMMLPPGTITAIIKTHEIDAETADTLFARSQAIWLSVRDPRDCVTSLMIYQKCTFDEALEMTEDAARFCLLVLHDPRTIIFRFEDNFFDAPATLDSIATTFGSKLSAVDKARIYAETRRPAIEAFIKTFPDVASVVGQPEPGHFVDMDTQWHTHHVGRDGEVGRWRRLLTARQIEIINNHLTEPMLSFGYKP